ncbi:hypothetical protein ACHWQZ_G018599 [Mnemiopsis leidyi]
MIQSSFALTSFRFRTKAKSCKEQVKKTLLPVQMFKRPQKKETTTPPTPKEELRNATRDVPAHHLLMVAGDLNAHLSKLNEEDSGWYWHQVSNRNGGLL